MVVVLCCSDRDRDRDREREKRIDTTSNVCAVLPFKRLICCHSPLLSVLCCSQFALICESTPRVKFGLWAHTSTKKQVKPIEFKKIGKQ